MNTFDVFQTLFATNLDEVQRLKRRRWLAFSLSLSVKEEYLGHCCYLAEEFLSSTDLCALKNEIGLSERQWRAYKARVSAQ